jgi:DNA-binding CsgD family transcriptional regulator
MAKGAAAGDLWKTFSGGVSVIISPLGKSRHGGKACSFGPTGAANRRIAVAGLRQSGNRFAAQNGPTHGQGALQPSLPALWNSQRYQASQTRDNLIPEATMFGGERYGKRVPNERERRVIELVAQGLKNSEVAEAIGTTEHVVKNYLRAIYDKLGLWNRVELALWYEARRHESLVHA